MGPSDRALHGDLEGRAWADGSTHQTGSLKSGQYYYGNSHTQSPDTPCIELRSKPRPTIDTACWTGLVLEQSGASFGGTTAPLVRSRANNSGSAYPIEIRCTQTLHSTSTNTLAKGEGPRCTAAREKWGEHVNR